MHLGLRPVTRWIDASARTATDVETVYRLRVESGAEQQLNIRQVIPRHVNGHGRLVLQGLATEVTADGHAVVSAYILALERNERAMEEIVDRVSVEPEVKAVRWNRTEA